MSFLKYENTEGAGYLALDLNAPLPTSHNYLPKLSLSIGIDLDKLKVPPQSSLSYFRVGGAPVSGWAPCGLAVRGSVYTTLSIRVNFVYR